MCTNKKKERKKRKIALTRMSFRDFPLQYEIMGGAP